MKKLFLVLNGILFVMMLFCFVQCKKKHCLIKAKCDSSNIILYNKSICLIQCYIHGRWKCIYGKGGIAANTIQYYDDYYWTFTADNRIIQSYKGNIAANTAIKWAWDKGTYTNGDLTFTMKFYDKENVPWVYVVDRIVDDTLILHDNSSDAVFYHFIKF